MTAERTSFSRTCFSSKLRMAPRYPMATAQAPLRAGKSSDVSLLLRAAGEGLPEPAKTAQRYDRSRQIFVGECALTQHFYVTLVHRLEAVAQLRTLCCETHMDRTAVVRR